MRDEVLSSREISIYVAFMGRAVDALVLDGLSVREAMAVIDAMFPPYRAFMIYRSWTEAHKRDIQLAIDRNLPSEELLSIIHRAHKSALEAVQERLDKLVSQQAALQDTELSIAVLQPDPASRQTATGRLPGFWTGVAVGTLLAGAFLGVAVWLGKVAILP